MYTKTLLFICWYWYCIHCVWTSRSEGSTHVFRITDSFFKPVSHKIGQQAAAGSWRKSKLLLLSAGSRLIGGTTFAFIYTDWPSRAAKVLTLTALAGCTVLYKSTALSCSCPDDGSCMLLWTDLKYRKRHYYFENIPRKYHLKSLQIT